VFLDLIARSHSSPGPGGFYDETRPTRLRNESPYLEDRTSEYRRFDQESNPIEQLKPQPILGVDKRIIART